LDDELPPVALLLPPVAFAPDVDVDVAPEVLLDVLDVVLGVVGVDGTTTSHSYSDPLYEASCPLPSP
jgi:hypothetical protein